MALETGTFISDLDPDNPSGTDFINSGDEHLRLIKDVIKNTFPNITGAVNLSSEDLNNLQENIIITDGESIDLNGNALINVGESPDNPNAAQPRSYNDERYHLVQADGGIKIPNNAAIKSITSGDVDMQLIKLDDLNVLTIGNTSKSLVLAGQDITFDIRDGGQLLMKKAGTTKNILAWVWPIGSIYESGTETVNPATLMSWPESTWVAFGTGRVLRGAESTDTLSTISGNTIDTTGATGGADNVTLSEDNIPSHYHSNLKGGYTGVDYLSGANHTGDNKSYSNSLLQSTYPNQTLTTSSYGEITPDAFSVTNPYITAKRWVRIA